MQKNGRVALCFFGDGASSEGTFHESRNIASIRKLPVIYLCENNGYAISTPATETISVRNIAVRAAGYGMPGHAVDGQDMMAVYEATATAGRPSRLMQYGMGMTGRYDRRMAQGPGRIEAGECIGAAEATKATSDLIAPVSGTPVGIVVPIDSTMPVGVLCCR